MKAGGTVPGSKLPGKRGVPFLLPCPQRAHLPLTHVPAAALFTGWERTAQLTLSLPVFTGEKPVALTLHSRTQDHMLFDTDRIAISFQDRKIKRKVGPPLLGVVGWFRTVRRKLGDQAAHSCSLLYLPPMCPSACTMASTRCLQRCEQALL